MKAGTVFPKDHETFGAWVGKAATYISKDQGVVIAKSVVVSNGFEIALSVGEDDKITLQHLGADGQLHWAEVTPEAYERAIVEMLETLKGKVKMVPKNTEEMVA